MKTTSKSSKTILKLVSFLTLLVVWITAEPSFGESPTFPDAPPSATGKVTVTLIPSGIATGWRFVGEQVWHTSGTQVTGLASGVREIEYRPIPNYIQPLKKTITLKSSPPTVLALTGEYYNTTGGATGTLTVTLKPAGVAALSIPQATRAQWRLLGQGNTHWSDSGASRNLLPGAYLIESKPVAGKTTPPPVAVTVLENESPTAIATYFAPDAVTGTQPSVLSFATVNSASLPYAYVGQLRTHNTVGTGCVVMSHTVATAAHLIFDEDNLTYFGGLQWLFQRHVGTYDPVPQIPQRVGILTGYASQRASDASPGQSSDRSRNYDVAALYFQASPGRNGWGGYQFSNATANEFLTSSHLKTLVGYPVNGITAANQGKMHATTPSNITFTANPDFSDFTSNDTYRTTDITSVGGAAGAPIFVRNSIGSYECVAIYLGGAAQTNVRPFTEAVDTLFIWANNDGQAPNGGITQVNGPALGGSVTAGALLVKIKPTSGRWKLGSSSTTRASNTQLGNLSPGTYTISFTAVSGFPTPSPVSVVVKGGATSEVNKTYTTGPPTPGTGPITHITSPKNNATVSKKGFTVRGSATDPGGIALFQVKITGKATAFFKPGKFYSSGRVNKGTIMINLRARNKTGVWGSYSSIRVKAK